MHNFFHFSRVPSEFWATEWWRKQAQRRGPEIVRQNITFFRNRRSGTLNLSSPALTANTPLLNNSMHMCFNCCIIALQFFCFALYNLQLPRCLNTTKSPDEIGVLPRVSDILHRTNENGISGI